MKLTENVMQFLHNLSVAINPQPAFAFAASEGAHDNCWCGNCGSGCSGGCDGGCEGSCRGGCADGCPGGCTGGTSGYYGT